MGGWYLGVGPWDGTRAAWYLRMVSGVTLGRYLGTVSRKRTSRWELRIQDGNLQQDLGLGPWNVTSGRVHRDKVLPWDGSLGHDLGTHSQDGQVNDKN